LKLQVLLPELISKIYLREMGCEDRRWMQLVQDRVKWLALVLAVLSLRVLLPESVASNRVPASAGNWIGL
jgi:hypothetical protein